MKDPVRKVGPNGYKLCKHGHERTPENVNPKSNACKECVKIGNKLWGINNPEKKDRHNKNFREANPMYATESSKRWRATNPGRVEEYGKEYRKANPEWVIEHNRNYNEKNPEYHKKYHAANPEKSIKHAHTRRAKIKGVGGELSDGLSARLMIQQKGKCRICKTKIEGGKYHRDHIYPIAKGGANSDSNIQLLCPKCNKKKGAKLPHIHAQELGMLFI